MYLNLATLSTGISPRVSFFILSFVSSTTPLAIVSMGEYERTTNSSSSVTPHFFSNLKIALLVLPGSIFFI